ASIRSWLIRIFFRSNWRLARLCRMPESFGGRLRHQREHRQVALATIAEQTKNKQPLLEARERDDVSQWPSGIFRRAFIRAYAQAVGLEPDAIVREFVALYPDPSEEVAAFAAAAASDAAHAYATPPTRLRQLVGSAVTSLTRLRPSTAPLPPDSFRGVLSETSTLEVVAHTSENASAPTLGR